MSIVIKDLNLSPGEIRRLLPKLCKQPIRSLAADEFLLPLEYTEVHIHLTTRSTRHIGALRLPSTRVSFNFSSYDENKQAEFLESFTQLYRRYGG